MSLNIYIFSVSEKCMDKAMQLFFKLLIMQLALESFH